jgi:hypothetical protein
LTHAIPARQQHGPHGVVPAAHGAELATPAPAHAANAGRGERIPSTPATAPVSATVSARRRETRAVATARAKSSNRSSATIAHLHGVMGQA